MKKVIISVVATVVVMIGIFAGTMNIPAYRETRYVSCEEYGVEYYREYRDYYNVYGNLIKTTRYYNLLTEEEVDARMGKEAVEETETESESEEEVTRTYLDDEYLNELEYNSQSNNW